MMLKTIFFSIYWELVMYLISFKGKKIYLSYQPLQVCSRLVSNCFWTFFICYIFFFDVIISELEKRLQGSNLNDLDKMDCKQTCKAAHVILHNTFSKNQLRDHKLYAQPLMHPFTNYLLHR